VRILVEAVVIVVSILLAFALDAWWDAKKEQDDLTEMLVLLDSELRRNSELLRASIEAHRAIESGLAETRASGTHRGAASPLITAEVFDPVTGALDALMASGYLRQIEDLGLRALIASLSGRFGDLAEKEGRALARRELARNRIASLGVRMGALPPGPRGEPNAADLPDDHPYYTDTELLNLLIMRGVEEREAIASGEALLGHISQIRSRLESMGIGSE
jgi:hypothetical protein